MNACYRIIGPGGTHKAVIQKQKRLARQADTLRRIATNALYRLGELLDRLLTNRSKFFNQHEREAARLRALIAIVSAPASKERLLEQAEEQERLAEELELIKIAGGVGFP